MKLLNTKKIILIGAISLIPITLLIIFRKRIFNKISAFKQNLTNMALEEWKYWNYGDIKEGSKQTLERLKKYWKEGAGILNWSTQKMIDEAWSSAFISYIMKKSNAGKDWIYTASHSDYIVDSIKNRKQKLNKKFKGYRPQEVKLKIGDLVGYPRQSGVTYDTVGNYKSHVDVVVKIKDGYAETIGGNISNSVSMTKVPLTKDGKIDSKKAPKYFVVIKNLK